VRSGRLGLAVGIAVGLLLAAGLLWLIGFVGASAADCPDNASSRDIAGLEAPRSVWPPGAQCGGPSAGQGEPSVAELVPGLGWAIVTLAFAGLVILATGLALEIRGLRSRSAPGSRAPTTQSSIRALAWPE
jgi:hypothetical protein